MYILLIIERNILYIKKTKKNKHFRMNIAIVLFKNGGLYHFSIIILYIITSPVDKYGTKVWVKKQAVMGRCVNRLPSFSFLRSYLLSRVFWMWTSAPVAMESKLGDGSRVTSTGGIWRQ